MITLKNLYTVLFFLGIFFIPFNEFEGLSFLGEYKNEAATYFFLIGFLFVIVEAIVKGKISIPYKNSLATVLILFIIWTGISTLINYETVSENYFKHTSGFSRYIRQTISLLISAIMFTILFWNVIRNYSITRAFLLIRKAFLYGLIFVSIYGFIEIGIVYFGIGFLTPILKSFDFFPFVNTALANGTRISSVSYEVPALGNYLITIAPWMFSYIITEKKLYRFIPSLLVLILMFFSDSRTALICISIQTAIFVLILLHDIRFRRTTSALLKIGAGLFAILLIIKSESLIETFKERVDRINFSKNLNQDVSNKSRFGMQYASMQVFKEHPIVGVGLGQDTYHKMYHYPYWAVNKNWEFKVLYKNQRIKSFPSAYNLYTRLLSELGIVGVALLIMLIFLCIYYSVLYWKFAEDKNKFMGVILILSFIGLSINWMQTDFFRQYGIWLCLVLLIQIRLTYQKKSISNE